MLRSHWAMFAVVLLTVPGAAPAAEETAGPAGTWKIALPLEGRPRTLWLVQLEAKDGKWTGKSVASAERVPEASVSDVSVTGDIVRFSLKVQGQRFHFEGKAPQKDAPKMLGSFTLGRQMVPVELGRTSLKTLDPYEVNKEIVARPSGGPEIIDAATELLQEATAKKAKPEEVRSWADKAAKAAEAYGPRLQRDIILRVATILTEQDGFAPVALEYARKAERALDLKDRAGVQKRVLDVLSMALTKAGKADEAKAVAERIKKIDTQVKSEPFAGRQGKSDRVVLVELFTGAQCPPCVAADLAFDALGKTFKPAEVVRLEYHLHIPGPDPLTNPDSEARAKYYGGAVEGTPTVLFNGRPGPGGGGSLYEAQDSYDAFSAALRTLLDEPAKAKLTASAIQKGSKIEIVAEVSDVDKPGEQVKLRLALVEETVNYTGGNKLSAHHHVVRALPGGAVGLVLKGKTGKQTALVDLDELRKELKKYLEDFARENKENQFPSKERPLDLKNLRVVAFIQDDRSKEVLQAVQVEVRAE